jgi:hypothetical protein
MADIKVVLKNFLSQSSSWGVSEELYYSIALVEAQAGDTTRVDSIIATSTDPSTTTLLNTIRNSALLVGGGGGGGGISGLLPVGGTLGQFLKKNSSTNYDAVWHTLAIADVDKVTVGPSSTFASWNSAGELSSVPGWTFDDVGGLQIGAQNSLVVPAGVTDYITMSISPTITNPGLGSLTGVQLNHQIDQPLTSYNGIQIYSYGTNKPVFHTSYLSNPGWSGTATNITHYAAGGNAKASNVFGFYLNPVLLGSTFTGLNINPSGTVNQFVALENTSSTATLDYTGIRLNPSGTVANTIRGFEFKPTSAAADATGIDIDLSGATITNRAVGASITGGTFSQFTNLSTISNNPVLVDSGNILRNVFTVAAGSPITGTDMILNNFAGFMQFDANYSGSVIGIGATSVGFVSQIAGSGSAVVSNVSMCTAGLSIDASSTGGTINDIHLLRAIALNAGGTLTINTIYGLQVEDGLSAISTTAFGVSVDDQGCENYFPRMVISGATKATTNDEVALEINAPKSIRIGRVTTAQRNAMTHLSGLLVFDTDLGKLFFNNGSGWTQI